MSSTSIDRSARLRQSVRLSGQHHCHPHTLVGCSAWPSAMLLCGKSWQHTPEPTWLYMHRLKCKRCMRSFQCTSLLKPTGSCAAFAAQPAPNSSLLLLFSRCCSLVEFLEYNNFRSCRCRLLLQLEDQHTYNPKRERERETTERPPSASWFLFLLFVS